MTTDEEEQEVVRNSKDVKDRRGRKTLWWFALILLAFFVASYGGGAISYMTLRDTAKDGTVLAQQIQEECKKPSVDADLAQFCPSANNVVEEAPSDVIADPVPGPPGAQGNPGAQGETGPAPTPQQVLVAVRQFCTDTGRCDGEDGRNASPAQVAIAVASYCNSRGQCIGPEGEPGQNGQDGEDGQDGADAPPVTQQQLIQAVEAFCGSSPNNCRGADGADSTVPGPQGEPGVVNIVDDCAPAPDGQIVADVNPVYNADNQTVIISCTYKDDEVGILP